MTMISYKLLDWIDPDKLFWIYLCRNTHAGQLLEKNIDKIDWENLSSNSCPRVIRILEQHTGKVDWSYLSANSGAVDILKKNQDKIHWTELASNPCPRAIELLEQFIQTHQDEPELMIDIWDILSSNPYAIHLLEKNPDKIDWYELSENTSAIHLLEKNLLHSDKIDWFGLSRNPAALHILEKNLDKIRWTALHFNTNPKAIQLLEKNPDKIDWQDISFHPQSFPLLEQNPDKIDWSSLSENSGAIHLLEKNQEKIDWQNLSLNPSIFTYDYEQMKQTKNRLHEDLIQTMFHPENIHCFAGWGFETYDNEMGVNCM
jgi:hypothetical protein